MKFPILSAAVAGIFWGTIGLFVRNLSQINSIEIVWFRLFFALIFLSSFVLISKNKPRPKNYKLLILNGLAISIWLPIYIASLNFGAKLGDAAFLLNTGYIFSILFSRFLLNEEVDKKTIYLILVSLVGVTLVLKPFELFQNFTEILALTSGLLMGLNLIVS